MRRTAPTIPVTPAMLRHFAAITVGATVCLAIFAQGENNDARAAVEAIKASSAPKGAKIEAPRQVSGLLVDRKTNLNDRSSDPGDAGGGGGGGGEGSEGNYYRTPPTAPGESAVSSAADVPAPITRDASGVPIPPGMQLKGGPPSANKQQRPPRRPTQAEYEQMLGASRLRASTGAAGGSAESSED